MRNEDLVTPEILRELIQYKPRLGHFVWKVRDPKWFASQSYCDRWNRKHAGKPAFCAIGSKGYRNGTVLELVFSAHRVAFAIYYGRWPSSLLDHRNGDRADCRISNLREGSHFLNAQNRKPARAIPPGVHFNKRAGKWMASIRAHGQSHYLGLFTSISDAKRARRNAERRLGYTGRAI